MFRAVGLGAFACTACAWAHAGVPETWMRFSPQIHVKACGGSVAEAFCPGADPNRFVWRGDTLCFDLLVPSHGRTLTERDYVDVARRLGVEVAAIKAVVQVETAGIDHGFNRDGSPIIRFEPKVFRTMTQREDVPLDQFEASHPMVFELLADSVGSLSQREQYERFAQACSIDSLAAVKATFWGMFQIGGFNWRRSGAKSAREFVELMRRSERDQLQLFAGFMESSGLLPLLKEKNWKAFARGYNGPGFARHAYDVRLARAYEQNSVN